MRRWKESLALEHAAWRAYSAADQAELAAARQLLAMPDPDMRAASEAAMDAQGLKWQAIHKTAFLDGVGGGD